jgi:small-conductance mechanosensitive channel
VRWLISKSFNTASDKLNLDPTRYKFFRNAAALIIWLVAFGAIISLIPKLKTLAITLFAGAGILVAIIGFAAQQAFSNIISGIFIVLFKPFRVGDMIKVGTLDYGVVEDITLRHTVINNFENKRIIIPNSVIGNETIVNDNIEDSKVCRFIEVGISYDSDVDLASRIIQEEAAKHPSCIDARNKKQKTSGVPKVNVRLMSFGDHSVNLRAYVWTNDPLNAVQMHSDINKAIKKRFDSEGVEIPFPYRTIVYKNDLPPNAKPMNNE